MNADDQDIIEGCRLNKPDSQKLLYKKYAPALRGICIRYAKDRMEAEDILQEGLVKVFTHIKQYSAIGSFEGWLKRIIINTAISIYKQNHKIAYTKNIDKINETDIENDETEPAENNSVRNVVQNANFSREDIVQAIQLLPDPYRVVFNLFAVENYKHKEIADMLDINVNTSKSQVMRARKLLQDILYNIAVHKR